MARCIANDGIVPVWSQAYDSPRLPLIIRADGPIHTDEIDESDAQLYQALTTIARVGPREATPVSTAGAASADPRRHGPLSAAAASALASGASGSAASGALQSERRPVRVGSDRQRSRSVHAGASAARTLQVRRLGHLLLGAERLSARSVFTAGSDDRTLQVRRQRRMLLGLRTTAARINAYRDETADARDGCGLSLHPG